MSGYDLICHVPLGIDGFSDSFCVALAAYDAKTDTIVILDASETCRQSSEVRVDETNGPGLSIDSMSWRAGPDWQLQSLWFHEIPSRKNALFQGWCTCLVNVLPGINAIWCLKWFPFYSLSSHSLRGLRGSFGACLWTEPGVKIHWRGESMGSFPESLPTTKADRSMSPPTWFYLSPRWP